MLFDVPGWNLGAPSLEGEKDKNKKGHKEKIKSNLLKGESFRNHKTQKDINDNKNVSASKDHKKVADNSSSKKNGSIFSRHSEQPVKAQANLKVTKPAKPSPSTVNTSGKSKLQLKMEEKLLGARFRYLNQKLYQSNSRDALQHFKQHPEDFKNYHEGFRSQVSYWPVNPVDLFIEQVERELSANSSKKLSIVDMGCGEAKILKHFQESNEYKDRIVVHSFDLVAVHPGVTVCDMSKVPLPDSSVDMVIFCLSLMNTNFLDALVEAKRILKPTGGILRVAEVESRFERGPEEFIKAVEGLGFEKSALNSQYKVFLLFEFKLLSKTKTNNNNSTPIDALSILKPCLYKKR